MKIAILGAGFSPIPPRGQGGTEWIVYHQARGLSEKGHEVVLFAGVGTKKNFEGLSTKVIEIDIGPHVKDTSKQPSFDPRLTEGSRKIRLEMIVLSEVCQKLIDLQNHYDIILNNMRGEAVFLPIAKLLKKPFVNVMHLNLFPELASLFRTNNTPLITISNAQRQLFPDLNYLGTVYNGVDTQKFPFNQNPKDYLLMVGTIGRHKNQKEAIAVAKELGIKLILAGKIRDQDYFEELKQDIDGEKIKWLGEMQFDEKVKLYQGAKAFLFPISWEEPFGLVMIEAMSCGTPVIAFNRGAVGEVVKNGLSGFVVEDHNEMVEAVRKIDSIDRLACRKHIEDNFTIDQMIKSYENALQKVQSML